MRLIDIAEAIGHHLKRMEGDPDINVPKIMKNGLSILPFYGARAYVGGPYVRVVYVDYHSPWSLNKKEAQDYLDWLEAGNAGTHMQMKRT